jgi:hypothetical protein
LRLRVSCTIQHLQTPRPASVTSDGRETDVAARHTSPAMESSAPLSSSPGGPARRETEAELAYDLQLQEILLESIGGTSEDTPAVRAGYQAAIRTARTKLKNLRDANRAKINAVFNRESHTNHDNCAPEELPAFPLLAAFFNLSLLDASEPFILFPRPQH